MLIHVLWNQAKDVFIINELRRALLEMCGTTYTEPLVLYFHCLHEAAKAVLTVKLSKTLRSCAAVKQIWMTAQRSTSNPFLKLLKRTAVLMVLFLNRNLLPTANCSRYFKRGTCPVRENDCSTIFNMQLCERRWTDKNRIIIFKRQQNYSYTQKHILLHLNNIGNINCCGYFSD